MVNDYHFHIYYSFETMGLAKSIGLKASEKLDLDLGRFHEECVGPHPRWSVQLLVPSEKVQLALEFFCLNRENLTLFIHPNTGEDLKDHRDRAIWMGEILELNLGIFKS